MVNVATIVQSQPCDIAVCRTGAGPAAGLRARMGHAEVMHIFVECKCLLVLQIHSCQVEFPAQPIATSLFTTGYLG